MGCRFWVGGCAQLKQNLKILNAHDKTHEQTPVHVWVCTYACAMSCAARMEAPVLAYSYNDYMCLQIKTETRDAGYILISSHMFSEKKNSI